MGDKSKQGEKENSAQSSQIIHIKDAEVSAVQALTHVNRGHFSHVKDPRSSADQPLLLVLSLADAIRCIIEVCQLL